MSLHGSQVCWADWVAIEVFFVATEFFFFALCHDRNFVSRQDLGLG